MSEEEDKLLDRLVRQGGDLPAEQSTLEAELALRRRLQRAAGLAQRQDTKAFLQTLEKKKTGATLIPLLPRKSWRHYAAVGLLLSMLAASLWWALSAKTGQADLVAALEPYPNVVTTPYVRGVDAEVTPLTQAMHAYERNAYETADQLFAQLPTSDTTEFYQAMVRLKTEGNTNDIQLRLTALSADVNQPFYWPASYYLAVLELADGKSAPAYEKLKRLKKQDAFPQLARRAEALLLNR